MGRDDDAPPAQPGANPDGPGADPGGPGADPRGPRTGPAQPDTAAASTGATPETPGRNGTPRRRLEAQERRAQILAAAERVFAGTSYERASVAAVAAEAGVSEPLVFRYFPTKSALATAAVQAGVDRVAARRAAADAALPAGTPARERVRTALEVELDEVAAAPSSWLTARRGGSLPADAAEVLAAARRAHVRWLRELLATGGSRRHDHALTGWPGFVTAVTQAWAEQGCPADERGPLIDATLGALEGALGDWGR